MKRFGMNIFDGNDGNLIGHMEHDELPACEHLIKIELSLGNAVELYFQAGNIPLEYFYGVHIQTNEDGYCSLIK